jgi:hypothetical protein
MTRTFKMRMQAEFEERYDAAEYVFFARGPATEAALLAMPAARAAEAIAHMDPEVARDFLMYRLYEMRYGEHGSTTWADDLAQTYDRILLEEAAT